MRVPFSSFRGLCQSFYNVHFNLTHHFQSQLKSVSSLHIEDKKGITNFIMGALGESPWMRKNTDRASQYFNEVLKDYLIKPASDFGLTAREAFDRQELIQTSLELERKRRRFPLRELSTCNPFVAQQNKESLVEKHCAVIVKEAAKILQANVRNMLRRQGDVQNIEEFVDAQLPFDHEAVTIDKAMFQEEHLEKAKLFLQSQNIHLPKIEEAFGQYHAVCCEAQSKRQHFQTRIEDIESLKEKYGEDNLKYEFSKVRLLYAVEWIARAKMVGNLYDYMPEVFALGQDEKPMHVSGDNYHKIEDSFKELKGLLGKQMLTTILGASINSSSREKDGRKGKYMIACDTEFHDYAKFPIRVVLTLLSGMVASNISLGSELGKDAQEVTEDFVRFASRFISGSHIAMRTLPENVIGLTKELISTESLNTDRLGLDLSETPVSFEGDDRKNDEPSNIMQPSSVQSMLIAKQSRG